MSKRLFLVAAACVAVFGPPAVAFAADSGPPPPICQSPDPQGDLPTCTYDGTQWNVVYPSGTNDPGFLQPSGDGMSEVKTLAIIGIAGVLALGIAGTVWRVRMARRIATDAGLNPDAAVAATLLGTGGLTATYLAATLHPQPEAPGVKHVEPPARSAEDRLTELKRLRDEGLVTDDEYTRRRTAIVDSV